MTPFPPLALGIPMRVEHCCIVPVVRTVAWTTASGSGGHVEVAGLFLLIGDETYAALLSDTVTMTDLIHAVRP